MSNNNVLQLLVDVAILNDQIAFLSAEIARQTAMQQATPASDSDSTVDMVDNDIPAANAVDPATAMQVAALHAIVQEKLAACREELGHTEKVSARWRYEDGEPMAKRQRI